VLTDTAGRLEELTAAVAARVRALRAARGWSLDELAGRSGVSKGMLVQIEAARTNPSLGTLCRIADAVGVTIGQLVEPDHERAVHVTAADDAPVLWRGAHGGRGRLLAGLNEPSFVELWDWWMAPGDRYQATDHPPGTREMLHILDGDTVVTVDGDDHAVLAGQTIEFAADRAHGYRNDATAPARLIMVVVTPSGEWDRRSRPHPTSGARRGGGEALGVPEDGLRPRPG
jgi:transcriptional regulator with XRE-family HTH domain